MSVLLAVIATCLPASIITDVPEPFQRNQRIGFNKTCHENLNRLTCVWYWGDGAHTDVAYDLNLGWQYHTFLQPGTYQVRYKRSAYIGPFTPQCGVEGSWTESRQITIQENRYITASVAQPVIGQPITFSAVNFIYPTNIQWDFGDGTRLSNQVTPIQHSYIATGTYLVQAWDGGPGTGTSPFTLTLTVSAPLRTISYAPPSPKMGETIAFSANNFVTPANITWDFGDGTIAANKTSSISHAYLTAGSFTVRAYDLNGNLNTAPITTTVSIPEPQTGISDEVNVLLAEITLDNGKSYKVVPKASRNIKGILRMKMKGTGIVSGYWLVDDQPFEFFQEMVYQGVLKTINTKPIPGLPAIQPGLHTLTVRLTRPVQVGIVLPILKYFVLPYANTIVTVSPADGFVAKETEKPEFSWQPASGASRYQIAFANELQSMLLDTPPLVWLDTLDQTAMVPSAESWQSIVCNRPVYWKVRALDSLGNVVAESEVQEFKIIVPTALLTFTEVTDLDGKPLTITNQSVRSKNAPLLVKGQIQYASDAAYLIVRVFIKKTLSDQLVIRDYRLGESRSFETSLATEPGNIQVEFQVLKSSSPSVIIGSQQLLVIQEN